MSCPHTADGALLQLKCPQHQRCCLSSLYPLPTATAQDAAAQKCPSPSLVRALAHGA